MDFYRDISAGGELAATVDQLTVNGQPIPETPFPMFPRLAQDGRVAYKANAGGVAMLVENGLARVVSPVTYGNWPCCWHPSDGTLLVAIDPSRYVWFNRQGEAIGSANLGGRYASEGIHHIEPDGTVVLGNEYAKLNGVIHGVQCWDMDSDPVQLYVVAKSNGGGPSGCIVRIHVRTGQAVMWIAPSDIPHPPRIYNGRLAISGRDTPAPADVDALLVPFKVYVPQPDQLPPLPTGPFRACWLDDMSGQGFGNAGGSTHPSAVFEDARFVLPADEAKTVALIHGPFEGSDLSRTLALGAKLKRPIIVTDDGHPASELQPTIQALTHAGLTVWHGVSCYPHPTDPIGFTAVQLDLKLSADTTPTALIVAGYAVHGRDEQDIALMMLAALDLKDKHPHIKAVLVFGLDRPPRYDWPRQCLLAARDATPVPVKPTPPVVLPPFPDPPVTPWPGPVDPPVVKRKKRWRPS